MVAIATAALAITSCGGSPEPAFRQHKGGGYVLTKTIPAAIEDHPEAFASADPLDLTNAWLTASHRRFTLVEAGAIRADKSVGGLVIFRDNFFSSRQKASLLKVIGSGPLTIASAPQGSEVEASAQQRGKIEFVGAAGVRGTLDLKDDAVTLRPQNTGQGLFVAGKLADSDGLALEAPYARASIVASGGEAAGVAKIQVAVDGKRMVTRRLRCPPSCPSSARLDFTYVKHRFGSGRHRVTISTRDRTGHVLRRKITIEPSPSVPKPPPGSVPTVYLPASNAAGLPQGAVEKTAAVGVAVVAVVRRLIGASPAGPPKAQPAYYMFARSAGDLRRNAAAYGARFARRQGPGAGLLVLDFGAARHKGKLWGTSLRRGTFFSNAQIASALGAAARSYSKHYRQGSVTIVYGNTNAHLGNPGPGYKPMDVQSAREAGRQQAGTVQDVKLYPHVAIAVGGDIEPGFPDSAPPKVAVALVAGAAEGGNPYYNFGTAPCTGNKCRNGWTVRDLCDVTAGGGRLALPQIYFSTPIDQGKQWAQIQRRCGIKVWPGASANALGQYSPAESWKILGRRTRTGVGPGLVVFPG